MSDSPSEPRAKRQRVDKKGRFGALERFKELKGGKNKCQVEEKVDDVYDVVDEREYAKRMREKFGDDWIEEDGFGYTEDGRDMFEDEDEYADDDAAENKGNNKQKKGSNAAGQKRARDDDKKAKRKGSIRNLFSNAALHSKPTNDDDVLADILGELKEEPKQNSEGSSQPTKIIAPAKIVSVTSNGSTSSASSSSISSIKKSEKTVANEFMNSFINNIKMKAQKEKSPKEALEDEMIDRILKPMPTVANDNKATVNAKKLPTSATITKKPEPAKVDVDDEQQLANETKNDVIEFPDDDADFNCLQSEDNPVEQEQPAATSTQQAAATGAEEKVKPNETEDFSNLLNNWESICQMDDNFEQEVLASNHGTAHTQDAAGLATKDNLRFWYWEAWEDAQKCPGVVYLFGRMADGKSVCVRVEQINRVLYMLPREYLLDAITKEPTKHKVTVADLYKEFDEEIVPELKLSGFRSRKVTKNFAYHSIGINVPPVCDYMEVHYDGKKAAPTTKKKYNSIAHIFGANTTALERFLLDCKIKGPCWLNLKQFRQNTAPISWCKWDVTVSEPKYVELVEEAKPEPPPPLTLLTLNIRTALNPKTMENEICMISMLVHNGFHIDKPAPQPAFNRHMCALTRPKSVSWPYDLQTKLPQYKSTRIHKHDTERALLGWFLAQYQQIDADLIVANDALDCQLNVLTEHIGGRIPQWSRLGRLRMTQAYGKRFLDFFVGRMVCDVKRSAEECLHARAYDLQTLCEKVLKIKENERMDVTNEELLEFYESGDGILKLITLTMQDASYILRLMCDLNIMPLALQITNICGNTMTRTLQGGRSERNEYLLLHAFTEKNYIVPDRHKREWQAGGGGGGGKAGAGAGDEVKAGIAARKKAAYSGGLVLDPIRGLYDKYVLLMDFNSLYPSIIQEYNICFTTVQQPYGADELPTLPDSSTEPGILPQQLRRLVESRRQVKKLMAAADLSPELKLQYHIRQMALKLTANSMYGCLGFAHSRFFAQHLAALVTFKGREILTNTKTVVQKMNYEVVYGDTDSIMVNTNIVDYEQVFKIGHGIKQNINKLYKQLELEIDGVFSCLLLLKKKKYAAVKVQKSAKGELQREAEYKGLDIVRRDWSQLAVMIGKLVLDEVLSEKQLDDKLDAVHEHLEQLKCKVLEGAVPLPMYIITKQLTKAPHEYANASAQPHVQVALRMNKERNRRYKKGDMVDYVICEDGTTNAAMQRAYHLVELKTTTTGAADQADKLKVDTHYYLAHQVHPVVTRMLEVLDGTDASRIAECLGLDPSKFKAAVLRTQQERSVETGGESFIKTAMQTYRFCEKFHFICAHCKTENLVAAAFKPTPSGTHEPVLQKCSNAECSMPPYQYVNSIRNQLQLCMRRHIQRFYKNWLVCDNPACNQNTREYPYGMTNMRLLCTECDDGVLVRQYSEHDLYTQLCYFQYMFDLGKQQQHQHQQKNVQVMPEVEQAYQMLCEVVEQQLDRSDYNKISLTKIFSHCKPLCESDEISHAHTQLDSVHLSVNVASSLEDN